MREIPGKPDIVFSARKKVVLLHGCFWHGHGCRRGRPPKSNNVYWTAKLDRNAERDENVLRALQAKGWLVRIVWECEAEHLATIEGELVSFLGPPRLPPKRALTRSRPATAVPSE